MSALHYPNSYITCSHFVKLLKNVQMPDKPIPPTHLNFYPLIILSLTILIVWLGLLLVNKEQAAVQANKSNPSLVTHTNQPIFEWRLVTSWPKNFPGLGEAPETFAKLVNEMSHGRLQVKVFGAGEIVPALGVFDAVSSGSVEMGHAASYYWKGKIPASPFFTAVPFGLNAQETSAWFHEGGGLELWRKLYKPFNLIPFSGGSTGIQLAGWFNRDIHSIADIKGLKMRIPGIAGEVFQRLGGTAVTIPGAELYTAMQTGVIDATEWVGPYNDSTFGLHEVARNYYYPGWHEPGSTLEFTVNESAWQSLPADLQAIAEVAMRAVNQMMIDNFTANNSLSLAYLKDQYNIEPKPLPTEVVAALKIASKQYYAELSDNNHDFNEVYQSYMSFYRQVELWHDISERAYYEARSGFSSKEPSSSEKTNKISKLKGDNK